MKSTDSVLFSYVKEANIEGFSLFSFVISGVASDTELIALESMLYRPPPSLYFSFPFVFFLEILLPELDSYLI